MQVVAWSENLNLTLANELGVSFRITSAPALERPRDIVGLLLNLKPGEIQNILFGIFSG